MTQPKYARIKRKQPLSFGKRRWLLGDDDAYWSCRDRYLAPPRVDLLWAEHRDAVTAWFKKRRGRPVAEQCRLRKKA
jgi:hypothetical protein